MKIWQRKCTVYFIGESNTHLYFELGQPKVGLKQNACASTRIHGWVKTQDAYTIPDTTASWVAEIRCRNTEVAVKESVVFDTRWMDSFISSFKKFSSGWTVTLSEKGGRKSPLPTMFDPKRQDKSLSKVYPCITL